MAFKQVRRRSSLFRPWASSVVKGGIIDVHHGDPLSKLKGFVGQNEKYPVSTRSKIDEVKQEVICSTNSSKLPKFSKNPSPIINLPKSRKHETISNLPTDITSGKKFSEESDSGLSSPFGMNPAVEQQDSNLDSDSLSLIPTKLDNQVPKHPYPLQQSMNPAGSRIADSLNETVKTIGLNPYLSSPPKLHFDSFRGCYPLDNSRLYAHSHQSQPTGDFTSAASLLSRDSMMTHMMDMGASVHIPPTWDARNLSSGITPISETSQQHLLEQGIASRWRTKKQRPKRFQCPHCQVSFSNNGQLKGHIRIHTGERPFACDHPTCEKTFTRNEELTRHKRIHTGVRPFPCPLCGKRFGRKDHLKKHVKTHQRAQMVPLPVAAFQAFPYFMGECVPWI